MNKKYNHIRASSLIIENLEYSKIVKAGRPLKFTKEKEKQTIARIQRTGPITKEQYENIFQEKLVISSEMGYFRISEVLSTLRKRFRNFSKFKEETFIYHKSNFKSVKLYHNYTTLEKIAECRKKFGITSKGIYYDDEIVFEIPGVQRRFLKPDAVMIKDNNLFIIEIDMAQETYKILKEKDEDYINIISSLKDKYSNIKVLFYTKGTRIMNIKNNMIFNYLDENRLIEYYEI